MINVHTAPDHVVQEWVRRLIRAGYTLHEVTSVPVEDALLAAARIQWTQTIEAIGAESVKLEIADIRRLRMEEEAR